MPRRRRVESTNCGSITRRRESCQICCALSRPYRQAFRPTWHEERRLLDARLMSRTKATRLIYILYHPSREAAAAQLESVPGRSGVEECEGKV